MEILATVKRIYKEIATLETARNWLSDDGNISKDLKNFCHGITYLACTVQHNKFILYSDLYNIYIYKLVKLLHHKTV